MNKPVVIIGGGLAGLYAAYRLTENNIPYLLLEAKPTLGGRIASHTLSDPTIKHDLGPTWIFPHQPHIQKLTTSLNVPLFNQYTQGDVLYQVSSSAAIQQIAGAGEMQLFRVQGGMYHLVDALYQQLDQQLIRLEHPVEQVVKHDHTWQITANYRGESKQFTCEHVIMALPSRMISEHLTPQLWANDLLTQRLSSVPTWMAAQAKFVATFEHAFWRDKQLSGQCFSRVGPLVEIHDASATNHDFPALFGFIGLPYLQRHKLTDAQLKQACLDQLADIFGTQAYSATQCVIKDWADDKYTANRDDRVNPAQHPEFSFTGVTEQLTNLNAYFVASEFSPQEAGYLEGAINAVDKAMPVLLNAIHPE